MKIVFVCNEYPPEPHGGIGTFVQTIAKGLRLDGHAVTVVGIGRSYSECVKEGIRIVTFKRLSLPVIGGFLSRLKLYRWLSEYVPQNDIDIIEVPDYEGMLPFRFKYCSVVVRLHNSHTCITHQLQQSKSKGTYLWESKTLKLHNNWIGVSQYILQLTKNTFRLCPEKTTVIYNPVAPIPTVLPLVKEIPDRFVLYAGTVSNRKGALSLARAAIIFMKEDTSLHLVYVGRITEENGKKIDVKILNIVGNSLSERVCFIGQVPREVVYAYMLKAKAFIFPSSLEACSLVVIEAMQAGCPVIYTKDPLGQEIIEDGVTGLLADPYSPEDVAEKTKKILDDDILANRLEKNAKEVVIKRFSLYRCINETLKFYEKCL